MVLRLGEKVGRVSGKKPEWMPVYPVSKSGINDTTLRLAHAIAENTQAIIEDH